MSTPYRQPTTEYMSIDDCPIAVEHRDGAGPGIVWLGGYRSDMDGTKAIELDRLAAQQGWACLRFDYSGHGKSGGDFLDGCISMWSGQAKAAIEQYCNGPQILVGSSMGAWVALRLAQLWGKQGVHDHIAGMVLLAPAPDFTVQLMEPALSAQQKSDLETKGYYEEPTPYGPEPNRFTKKLFDDGRQCQVMTGSIDTYCPVHIIQGKADPDVPWQHAERLYTLLSKDNATLSYVKNGDHRLSRPQDIDLILRSVQRMRAQWVERP